MRFDFSRIKIYSIFIALLIVSSLYSNAQNTFTVVCDKTDNTVKIVNSEIRSPNYVPIKGGFPFRQVAEKWINENLSSRECKPEEIIKQNQTKSKPQSNVPPVTTKNQTPQNQPSNQANNNQISFKPPVDYKNTSFILDIKFSNLGDALRLDKNLVPGAEIGVEQLIGTKFYFGTGILFNTYTANLESIGGDDYNVFYFGRIPAFLGYRMKRNKLSVMYETGVHVNTKIVSIEDDKRIPGQIAKDNSVNFLGRIKIGSETVLLEMGSEIWLSKIFEDEDFNMSSVYVGLRVYF